jgi:hypothetical protein
MTTTLLVIRSMFISSGGQPAHLVFAMILRSMAASAIGAKCTAARVEGGCLEGSSPPEVAVQALLMSAFTGC